MISLCISEWMNILQDECRHKAFIGGCHHGKKAAKEDSKAEGESKSQLPVLYVVAYTGEE